MKLCHFVRVIFVIRPCHRKDTSLTTLINEVHCIFTLLITLHWSFYVLINCRIAVCYIHNMVNVNITHLSLPCTAHKTNLLNYLPLSTTPFLLTIVPTLCTLEAYYCLSSFTSCTPLIHQYLLPPIPWPASYPLPTPRSLHGSMAFTLIGWLNAGGKEGGVKH